MFYEIDSSPSRCIVRFTFTPQGTGFKSFLQYYPFRLEVVRAPGRVRDTDESVLYPGRRTPPLPGAILCRPLGSGRPETPDECRLLVSEELGSRPLPSSGGRGHREKNPESLQGTFPDRPRHSYVGLESEDVQQVSDRNEGQGRHDRLGQSPVNGTGRVGRGVLRFGGSRS